MTQAVGGGWRPMPTPGRQRRGVLGPVVAMVALGMSGLVVLGLLGSSIGPTAVVVGTLCALLPVGPVVATFLWIDRWEPEPPRLLLYAFLWGACFAALSALLVNSGAVLLIDELVGRGSGDVIGSVVVAPVVEEAVKGAFLVGMLLFRRREFDGVVDGIVYAGMVAAGFAFTENILYLGRAFAEESMAGQSGGVLTVLVLRGVLSPFAHPLFTAMTGIGAGIAADSRSRLAGALAVGVGYLAAVVLHGLWNGVAALSGGLDFFGFYALVMVPLFLAMVAVVIWQRRREQRTVAAQLPGFAAAGWIAASEVTLLSTLAGRSGWRSAVRRNSGRQVAKAVADYQAAVTELAFLRARMARGAIGAAGARWHEEALAEVLRTRATAVGHPEALTVALRHHGAQPGWTPPPPGPPPAWTAAPPGRGPGWARQQGTARPDESWPPGWGPPPRRRPDADPQQGPPDQNGARPGRGPAAALPPQVTQPGGRPGAPWDVRPAGPRPAGRPGSAPAPAREAPDGSPGPSGGGVLPGPPGWGSRPGQPDGGSAQRAAPRHPGHQTTQPDPDPPRR